MVELTEGWDGEAAVEKEEEKQSATADATTWKPETDDVLVGTLIDAKFIVGDYGPSLLLNITDKDTKTWAVWAGSKIIREAVREKAPAIGKGISIKYGGKKQPKKAGANAYHVHFVQAEASDEEFWHDLYKTEFNQGQPPAESTEPDGMSDPF